MMWGKVEILKTLDYGRPLSAVQLLREGMKEVREFSILLSEERTLW